MEKLTYEAVETVVENIPTAFADRIARKLKALTKRLAKMGAPAPTIEFGPVIDLPFDDDSGDEFLADRTYPAFETVTVRGFEAKAAGFTGVAVLDWTVSPDEAFVARFPGHDDDTAETISEELRTRGPVCDHCGTNRKRNNTVVFAHDDGRMIAVGTGCILEYLGVDPRTILMLSDFVASVSDRDGSDSIKPSMTPHEFVALAAELTRFFGFVRSGDEGSTKDLATLIGITGLTTSGSDRALAAELADAIDMARGRAKADEIAAWIAEDNSSDFLHSASVALSGNEVTAGARHAGILAALPFSHDRHTGLVAERVAKAAAAAEARQAAEFIGSVGDKLTVTGTVTFFGAYDGQYGMSYRVTIVTDTGDRVTTYGSGQTLRGWASGDTVEMTGKIKDHDDHAEYGKSTVLERVKIVELTADGEPVPTCSKARCARPGQACTDCGDIVCVNGHGRGHGDDRFLCETCLDSAFDAEDAARDAAKASINTARIMLGAPGRMFDTAWITPLELETLVAR